eukprot:g3563.t1
MDDTEIQFLLFVRTSWSQCIGRFENDSIVEYIFESVVADLLANGIPESPNATIDRFEDIVHNSQKVDIDDCHEFCTCLFHKLQKEFAEGRIEDEEYLAPGQCEICERVIPLTRHHLIPRTLHQKLKKKGYQREALNQTISICRCCHSAVHRFHSIKDLAFNFNTIDKLMKSEAILKHALWASKQPVRTKR